jgi:hypothetical protein
MPAHEGELHACLSLPAYRISTVNEIRWDGSRDGSWLEALQWVREMCEILLK